MGPQTEKIQQVRKQKKKTQEVHKQKITQEVRKLKITQQVRKQKGKHNKFANRKENTTSQQTEKKT